MKKHEITIIQQGDKAKFRVTNERPDFEFTTMDFHIELIYGMQGKSIIIPKAECLVEDDSQCVFSFLSEDMVGYVIARMVMQVKDDDEPNGIRQEVDEQMLCFVATEPCVRLNPHIGCEDRDHDVKYEYVPYGEESSVYVILRDVNGKFLRDANELVLRARKKNIINN